MTYRIKRLTIHEEEDCAEIEVAVPFAKRLVKEAENREVLVERLIDDALSDLLPVTRGTRKSDTAVQFGAAGLTVVAVLGVLALAGLAPEILAVGFVALLIFGLTLLFAAGAWNGAGYLLSKRKSNRRIRALKDEIRKDW